METVVVGVVILGLLGLLFGFGLAMAGKVFAVDVDPRVEKLLEVLPGANCGACGNPGCSGFAEGLVEGRCDLNDCPVCSPEARKAAAEILGVEVGEAERRIAVVHCRRETVPPRFEYHGVKDCAAAQIVYGGFTTCRYGCLGLGTCVEACPFGAMYMGEDGLPHIIEDKCTGCGNCVRACPRGVISLAPVSRDVHVLCNSKHPGKYTRDCCTHGCIGCKRCEKTCKHGAITVTDFLATIDYDKCVNCGECVEVCPTGAIGDVSLLRDRKPARERYAAAAAQEG